MILLERNVRFAKHETNLRLANTEVELIIPIDYGPRVLRYARHGGRNILGEISPETQGVDTPFGARWHSYGGHRLWHAPEHPVRTYWPDNLPVRVEAVGQQDTVTLTQTAEPHTGIEKSVQVTLADEGSRVSITHQLTNRMAFDVEVSAWALTVMAPDGLAIFPQPPFVPHPAALAPARPLVTWPFTRMDDPRWTWGHRFLCLRQDRARKEAQKVGMYDDQGWMAYHLGDLLFLKRHYPLPGAHPDFGCNVETFTDDAMLELETLSPLARLAPEATLRHREEWFLYQGVELGASESDIADALAPLLSASKSELERSGPSTSAAVPAAT